MEGRWYVIDSAHPRCELPLWIGHTTFRLIECVCGRRYVAVPGDGMITPPRLYWKRVRRLHLRRYWKSHG